jgi:hypothetical protein
MGWLVALLVLALLVWLLITSARFRIAAATVVAVLVIIVFYFVEQSNKREARSHSLIAPSQLEFKDVVLDGYHPLAKVKGTLKNNSTYTLTATKLKVTVYDCQESPCIVIGEDNDVFISTTVPPSQLRAFDGFVSLHDLPIAKRPRWKYQIVEITAKDSE